MKVSALVLTLLALLIWPAGPVLAHEERESQFPPGDGRVPTYRTQAQAADVIVVCKRDSRQRIKRIQKDRLRRTNRRLLRRCEHRNIQAAVDAVRVQRTNIYVLPGVYRERPSWNARCTRSYDGGIVDYPLSHSCGEVVNLVTIAGDDPDDPDIVCDNQLCRLQIAGTGGGPRAVQLVGGFRRNGDWVKHNGIKADRADGFHLSNITASLFRENAIYVHETDGYVVERFVAKNNDLYGLLTFASDHGLVQRCNAHHNGDSGIYPGSAADVNAQSTETGPLQRWAVEVRRCRMHHNALGFSGTAGNSVYVHHNRIDHNGIGYVVESILGGHPGMPQDHGWFENNKIFSNNVNYYGNVQGEDAPCQAEKPVDRGHQRGVVCPAFALPVGTGGMMIGNHNFVHSNHFYDNWRQGVMLFWVPPAALRGDYDPTHQDDNSNHNAFTQNEMGYSPSGKVRPNGLDFWWDDAGVGNCWQDNLPARGKEITHNASVGDLPTCGNSSQVPVSNPVKTVQLVPCAAYDRYSNPEPAGCDWTTTPPRPTAGSIAAAAATRDPEPLAPAVLAAALGLVAALTIRAGIARSRRSP